jgi:nicotinate-nucleotide adenylyltransferase
MHHTIGIFGGSFNPIHCGHIALAEIILRQKALDEVWLMVSPQNPLKQQADLLADKTRLLLARKALEGVHGIKASDFEFSLPRPSYTWHTLEALRTAYPDDKFALIIGGDNWDRFDQWYRAKEIKEQYPIIVYPRKGEANSTSNEGESSLPLFDISSTDIRNRVHRGESIEGLVPNCIIDDVLKLYA